MSVFQKINKYPDVAVITNAYIKIQIPMIDQDGNPIPLASSSRFGCTIEGLGNSGATASIDIQGVIDGSVPAGNVMIIHLEGTYTNGFSDVALIYCPYAIIESRIIRPGFGRLFVFSAGKPAGT